MLLSTAPDPRRPAASRRTPQFELAQVDDPYGYASATELSLFRRPLASTNLRFLSTVMWDGRETFRDSRRQRLPRSTRPPASRPCHFDLADQANTRHHRPRPGATR